MKQGYISSIHWGLEEYRQGLEESSATRAGFPLNDTINSKICGILRKYKAEISFHKVRRVKDEHLHSEWCC